MTPKKITLTESHLHKIVLESVMSLLAEGEEDDPVSKLITDSSNDGRFQTYKVMIPIDKKPQLDSFLKKSQKALPELEWAWSPKSRKSVFTHVAKIVGEHGVTRWNEEHEFFDAAIKFPISCNGWQLMATVERGDLMVVDLTKKFTPSNPEHGAHYRKCDACGRPTEAMFYIIRNQDSGEEVQVGSSCAKKYGIGLMKLIYAFERELYRSFTLYSREMFDDEEKWGGAYRIKWNKTIPVEQAVNAALLRYDKNPQYDKGRGGTIEMMDQSISYGEVDENPGLLNRMRELFTKYRSSEYDKFKDFLANTPDGPQKDLDAFEWEEDSFEIKLYKAVFDCAYICVRDLWQAFFAVKKFKEFEALENSTAKELSVGDVIKINGKITKTDTYIDPYSYHRRETPVYWIETDDGYKLKRTGVVPFDPATKRVENAYAKIKWAPDNKTIYVLDRVTKKPPKGTKAVNESARPRRKAF